MFASFFACHPLVPARTSVCAYPEGVVSLHLQSPIIDLFRILTKKLFSYFSLLQFRIGCINSFQGFLSVALMNSKQKATRDRSSKVETPNNCSFSIPLSSMERSSMCGVSTSCSGFMCHSCFSSFQVFSSSPPISTFTHHPFDWIH